MRNANLKNGLIISLKFRQHLTRHQLWNFFNRLPRFPLLVGLANQAAVHLISIPTEIFPAFLSVGKPVTGSAFLVT